MTRIIWIYLNIILYIEKTKNKRSNKSMIFLNKDYFSVGKKKSYSIIFFFLDNFFFKTSILYLISL